MQFIETLPRLESRARLGRRPLSVTMLVVPTASWVPPRRAPVKRAWVPSAPPAPRPAPQGIPNVRPSFPARGISERWVVWYPRKGKKSDGDGTTKKQLRQMADKAGVVVDKTMSKKQLREALQVAGVAVETKKQLRGAAEKAGVWWTESMSKQQLREATAKAISKTKAEKEGAQTKKEGAAVNEGAAKSAKEQRKEAAEKAAAEKAEKAAEKAEKALAVTLDESDPTIDSAIAAEADADAKTQKVSRLKRAISIVGMLLFVWVAAVAAAFDPGAAKAVARVVVSLALRLATGSKSSDGVQEAALCVFSILVLRLFLERTVRSLYFWWTSESKPTEETWQESSLHWFVMEVYAPIEIFLVAVASLRFAEGWVERFGLVVPETFNLVIDTVVRTGLVLAFSRVFLAWQQRAYQTQQEQFELKGETFKSERLAGIKKLSTIATYVLAAVLGLKVCGVDVGALVTFGGISGLAIGLAGRQILENAFMGLMLYATAPFQSGDEIRFSTSQVKDIKGYVLDIGLFRTTIRSMQREVYYLPNSLFSTLAVLNVSRRGKFFRVKKEVIIRLDDAAKLPNAMSNFRSVVKSDPRVVRNLHRRVFLDQVSTEGLHVKISFFVEAVNKDQFFAIQSDMLQVFLETFRKNDVRVAPKILATMAIDDESKKSDEDGLDGPLVSEEAAAALSKLAKEKDGKEGGLAAALTALTKGGSKYEGAG